MSNFKVGQKVVCIKVEDVCVYDGSKTPHPKINEMVSIRGICFDGWLELDGYEGYDYEPWNFRPLDHQFAEDVIAYIKELELV